MYTYWIIHREKDPAVKKNIFMTWVMINAMNVTSVRLHYHNNTVLNYCKIIDIKRWCDQCKENVSKSRANAPWKNVDETWSKDCEKNLKHHEMPVERELLEQCSQVAILMECLAWLQWCDECIERLEELCQASAPLDTDNPRRLADAKSQLERWFMHIGGGVATKDLRLARDLRSRSHSDWR